MILEGHSLKEAFTRYHLTTPEVLREVGETEHDRRSPDRGAAPAARGDRRSQKSDYDALGRVVGVKLAQQNGQAAENPVTPA